MKICEIDECTGIHVAQGLCSKHYDQARRKHDLVTTRRPTQGMTIKQRLDHHVEKSQGEDGCWIWQASKNQSGYGQMWINGKTSLTHRHVWEIYNGPIRNGLLVCHTCDTPACNNPDHLFLGTYKDNSDDMISKKRQHHPSGDKHPGAKLKDSDITIIRELISKRVSLVKIASSYNVQPETIGAIKSGKTWKLTK